MGKVWSAINAKWGGQTGNVVQNKAMFKSAYLSANINLPMQEYACIGCSTHKAQQPTNIDDSNCRPSSISFSTLMLCVFLPRGPSCGLSWSI